MKRNTLIVCGLVLILGLTGCGAEKSDDGKAVQSEESQNASDEVTKDEMFTDRDRNASYDESKSARIVLNGTSAECDSDAVKIDGSTITITDEGTYILSGSLEDGMVIVNADDSDKPQLVFDNVIINSETSAPLYIAEADKVVVTLAEGSENILSNGGTFTAIDDNNIDSVVFSKQDLSFNGEGSLAVQSPVGHGIVSKDDLVLTSGTYSVESASHGFDANDSVRIMNSTITIASGKDGIHAENSEDDELGFVYVESGTFDISAEGDGMSAGSYMQIEDGSFEIASGDDGFHADETLTIAKGTINITESYEGLEALDIKISGGDIKIVSSDDGINAAGGTDSSAYEGMRGNDQFGGRGGNPGVMEARGGSASNGSIVISGGTIYMNASGDGIDANGSLEISGGYTTICGPTVGDTAVLDYDTSAVISGGTFIGTGSTMMAQTFSDSKQGVIAVSVGRQVAGTQITLEDEKGTIVMEAVPALDFGIVIMSSPDIVKGETYKITVGEASGEFAAN